MVIKLTIDEFRVNRLNYGQKFMDTSFKYKLQTDVEEKHGTVNKKFNLGDNIVNFVMAIMSEIKKTVNPTNNPAIDVHKKEEIRDKIVNHMNRLMTEVNDLIKITEYDKYMKALNKINCYKIVFPEIETETKKVRY